MKVAEESALKPLAAVDGEPAFDEAWQAQVLAIADTLVHTGLYSAGEWSQTLGEELAAAEARGSEDNQQTYYQCALRALETLVSNHSEIDHSAMHNMRKAWEQAYRSTPHGQPVTLDAKDAN